MAAVEDSKLKVGDTIQCIDKDEMLKISFELAIDHGIQTDFIYEKDGDEWFGLVVTSVEE